MGKTMKRYRWTNFFLDTTRNMIRDTNVTVSVKKQVIDGMYDSTVLKFGAANVTEKFDRWFSLNPPDLCVPVEYHELLREVEGSYIRGDYYPGLTGACCLGERILNHLVIGLKNYYKTSLRYKEVAAKESIQDWGKAIEILIDWGVITEQQARDFGDLLSLRNPAVHFGDVKRRSTEAYKALNLVYSITKSLFGHNIPIFFWAPGEIYIKNEKENDPFVKVFLIPHCVKVGFNHEVRSVELGSIEIYDPGPYPEEYITDETFVEHRTAALKRLANA
jgi:hypothetical protein